MQTDGTRLRNASILSALCAILWAPACAQAGDLYSFNTPSRNIYCMAYNEGSGATVECEIRSVTRRTLKIARPQDCDLDWGDRFAIGERGRVVMTCYGDTLLSDDSHVLAYGRTQDFDGISCSSSQKGLRCTNRSGHGFFLSKASQQVF